MLELVQYIVNQFAEDKEHIEYAVNEKERVIEIVVTLPSSDMGKVIGKQGKIAKALRTIVRAATPRNSKRYVVEIKEKGGNAVDRERESRCETEPVTGQPFRDEACKRNSHRKIKSLNGITENKRRRKLP